MSSRSELDREPGGNRGTEPGRVLDASPAIHLTGLTKTFGTRAGDVEAVRGVDLTVARGEIVALLGPNGAGKTTMLDMIFGFTNPTGGSCRVFGWSPRQAVETGLVGGLLQTGALLPDLTVRETVAMVAGQYADPLPVEEALARAGITRIARRKVSACSGANSSGCGSPSRCCAARSC